jgi:hypothetical protein
LCRKLLRLSWKWASVSPCAQAIPSGAAAAAGAGGDPQPAEHRARIVFGCKTDPGPTTATVALEPMCFCAAAAGGGEVDAAVVDEAAAAGVHVTRAWTAACTHLLVLPGEAGGAAAARPATQACFMLSGAPAVSLEFLQAGAYTRPLFSST